MNTSDDIPHDDITLLEATTDQLIKELCRRSEAVACSYITVNPHSSRQHADHHVSWGIDAAVIGLSMEMIRVVQKRIDIERQEQEEATDDDDDENEGN